MIAIDGTLKVFRRYGPVCGKGTTPGGKEQDFHNDEAKGTEGTDDLDDSMLRESGSRRQSDAIFKSTVRRTYVMVEYNKSRQALHPQMVASHICSATMTSLLPVIRSGMEEGSMLLNWSGGISLVPCLCTSSRNTVSKM